MAASATGDSPDRDDRRAPHGSRPRGAPRRGNLGHGQRQRSLDSQLFSLTNQDRTSNGVRSLTFSGTLQNIGEAAPYNCHGIHISGRSKDMITRNYFAHLIPGCGQYVFSMMQAFGVHYRSAAENIGLNAYGPNPVADINGAFMASRDHRPNILNPNYTEMGVGSYATAAGATWTGSGSALKNVWMFSEEFAQVGISSPPPPHKPPSSGPATRNSRRRRRPGSMRRDRCANRNPLPTATRCLIPIGSLPESLPAPLVGSVRRPVPEHDRSRPRSIPQF